MSSSFCLLVDPLPETVEIQGEQVPIRTDFRISILFELAMLDPELSREQKLESALKLYYYEPPADIEEALERAAAFYKCEAAPSGAAGSAGHSGNGSAGSVRQAYDFLADDRYLYAAFLQQYGIDLTAASLHWWQFRALFQSLSQETMLMKIMGWREMKIDPKASPEEKARLRKLKEAYALPSRKSRSDQEKQSEIMQVLMNGGDLSAHSL